MILQNGLRLCFSFNRNACSASLGICRICKNQPRVPRNKVLGLLTSRLPSLIRQQWRYLNESP